MNIKDRDPGDSMNGDIPYKDALDFDIPTLVRETGQNVLDASEHTSDPAKIVYRWQRLDGTNLDRFKRAIDWDDYRDHLERFRDEDTSLRIDDFLNALDEGAPLDVFVVEDHNTHGLYGGEIEDGTPYNALVRDSKITVKDDDTAGGSHGVGKFVNYGLSLPSMALFYSDLDPDLATTTIEAADVEEQIGDSPRLVGRALLPDHRRTTDKRILDGEEIWFGQDDPTATTDRPVSMWGADAEQTAAELGLERPDIPGTSIAIVGFGQPDGDVPPNPDDALATLKHAAAYHFWPAMEMDQLKIEVVAPDGTRDELTVDTAINDFAPEIGPFVKTFRQYQQADNELDTAGDVAKTSIEFDFKPKGSSPVTGEVNVGVRVPTAADYNHDDLLNHVAIFRGRGMVVDYLSKQSLGTRGQEFHAILAAGNARPWPTGTPTPTDSAVDTFLRAAEPAEHDEWDNQPKLQQNYKGRCAGTVRDLQGNYLKDAILPLIRTSDDNDGDLVPAVSQLFNLDVNGVGGGGDDDAFIRHDVRSRQFDSTTRQWTYETTLSPKPDDHGPWRATVAFRPKGDDNNKAGDVDVAQNGATLRHPTSGVTVDTEVKTRRRGPDLRVATVKADADVSEVSIRVTSIQLPSIDPRRGDIGAISISATGEETTPASNSPTSD